MSGTTNWTATSQQKTLSRKYEHSWQICPSSISWWVSQVSREQRSGWRQVPLMQPGACCGTQGKGEIRLRPVLAKATRIPAWVIGIYIIAEPSDQERDGWRFESYVLAVAMRSRKLSNRSWPILPTLSEFTSPHPTRASSGNWSSNWVHNKWVCNNWENVHSSWSKWQ